MNDFPDDASDDTDALLESLGVKVTRKQEEEFTLPEENDDSSSSSSVSDAKLPAHIPPPPPPQVIDLCQDLEEPQIPVAAAAAPRLGLGRRESYGSTHLFTQQNPIDDDHIQEFDDDENRHINQRPKKRTFRQPTGFYVHKKNNKKRRRNNNKHRNNNRTASNWTTSLRQDPKLGHIGGAEFNF